jgi:hypothetical protein
MALVVFESRVNMLTVATPSVGGYVIAYDSLDGILKQKNDQGVITRISGSSSPGSLAQTLAIGNNSGTHSINLGANCRIGTGMGGGQLRLDNGINGANIVNLSTDYGTLAQSYLYMSSNSATLQSVNAGLSLTSASSNLQVNTSNLISIRSNNAFITLNGFRVLDFTNSTTPSIVGNRVNVLISTSNSNLNAGVFNTVVLGGYGITGATSNSVYVPKLYVKDGGFVKGTVGAGQLTFTNENEVFLSSNTTIMGILGTNSTAKTVDHNGIFIIDNADNITTTTITSNTFISTSNTTVDSGLNNVIVIGGDMLSITQSNTTYIGGSVSIGNSYILPSEDGTSGQVIKTDGSGNTYWGPLVGSLTEITALSYQTPFTQSNKGIGEIVFFGTASTTLDTGFIYQFTAGEWEKADKATSASASGLLAIALGEYVSDGLLLGGYATFDYSPYGTMTIGSILYLNDNGTFIQTPTTTSGEIVRVIGYCVDEPVSSAGTLYFCPDTTWTEIP